MKQYVWECKQDTGTIMSPCLWPKTTFDWISICFPALCVNIFLSRALGMTLLISFSITLVQTEVSTTLDGLPWKCHDCQSFTVPTGCIEMIFALLAFDICGFQWNLNNNYWMYYPWNLVDTNVALRVNCHFLIICHHQVKISMFII